MIEQTKAWPVHYSAEDVAIIQRLGGWMVSNGYTQAAISRLVRIGNSTLSQILSGAYPSSPTGQLARIAQAMANIDDTPEGGNTVVETSVYRQGITACNLARMGKDFSVFSSRVGTGKTFCLKDYAKKHANTHLIETDSTMTRSVLVDAIAASVLGVYERTSISRRFAAIVEKLKDTDSLLIIDEAEKLTIKELELVRRIRDKANIGVVLAGTEYLFADLEPKVKDLGASGQFGQIRSRVGFKPAPIAKITKEDAVALIQAGFANEEVCDDVIDRLYQYSAGSARVLCEGLIRKIHIYRKDSPLDVGLVDGVALNAMNLKLN